MATTLDYLLTDKQAAVKATLFSVTVLILELFQWLALKFSEELKKLSVKTLRNIKNNPAKKPDPKKKKVEEDDDENQGELYEGNIKFEVTVSMLEIYNE